MPLGGKAEQVLKGWTVENRQVMEGFASHASFMEFILYAKH